MFWTHKKLNNRTVTVCKNICEFYDFRITHLTLQKLLYMYQMAYYKTNNQFLIEESFMASNYGPIIHDLFKTLSKYGNRNIPAYAFRFYKTISLTEKELFDLAIMNQEFSKYSSVQLLSLVRKSKGAWAKNYQPYKYTIISKQDIIDEIEYYVNLIERNSKIYNHKLNKNGVVLAEFKTLQNETNYVVQYENGTVEICHVNDIELTK